jgi:hypothetical protein
MQGIVLSETRFEKPASGWAKFRADDVRFQSGPEGLLLSAEKEAATLNGPGVHTRNGDAIEVHFQALAEKKGRLRLGFAGGMESAVVTLDFRKEQAVLKTSDWTCPQPAGRSAFRLTPHKDHILRIEKTEGKGNLVKFANIRVVLDGEALLEVEDVNVLPEMGVTLGVSDTRILIRRFVHRGVPSEVPEHLHVGGWQVLNRPDIEENLASLRRGLMAAAEKGVQLLVTPETSLTGLFPTDRVTREPKPVAVAEQKLRGFIRDLKSAPYVVVGLPVWEAVPGHRRRRTRYNVSRVYDPDGAVVDTYPKIHSCETEFWHGYRLQEFDVYGVPVCMHICHDGRYPEVWTLPVMFGARLILHPCNGGTVSGSIDAFERSASRSTSTSHAFRLCISGGGGSYIAGPQKFDNVIVISAECRRDVRTFPMVGPPHECLVDAKVRIWDAFGYWPVRSFRASEEVASTQVGLYRALGGRHV